MDDPRAAGEAGTTSRSSGTPRVRLTQAGTNAALVTGLVTRQMRHDPVAAALTAAGLLPRRLRDGAARTLLRAAPRPTEGVRAALGHWLAGHAGEATAALRARRPGGPRLRRHLAGELAVHLGEEAVVDARHPDLAAVSRARRLWRVGDVSAAVAAVDRPDTRQEHRRLASELRVLTPGFRLAAPPVRAAAAPARTVRPPLVLHLLNNALPTTQSGYTVRSQAVLRAHAAGGLHTVGVTRIGYPVNRGRAFAGHEVQVDGVRYRRLLPTRLSPERHTRLDQSAAMLARVARQEGARALATTTRFENALVVDAVARALDLPWVYEVRGALEDTWLSRRPAHEQDAARGSEWYRRSQAREGEFARAADHVVTLNATMRAALVARGVPDERITVVPNGIDPALLERQTRPAAARERLGLPREGFWVGAVSSLVPYEGFGNVLRAVARLRGDGVDARALLVGEGSSLPGLRALAAELGIAHAVHLPGGRPHSEAVDWVQALDAVTLPRVDTQVTRTVSPSKPVEAMALARPLVVSDLPALAEIVGEDGGDGVGEAGLLVQPGRVEDLAAALQRLQADPDLRAALAARGRDLARERTWERLGRSYAAIYRGLGVA